MDLSLLPQFGGELLEPWEFHEARLLSWLRLHHISEQDDKSRVDFLFLSLKPNSTPLHWFINQPADLRVTFTQSLHLLQNKYGNDLRKEMHRISAMNCLEVRSFRDNEHKTEMVFELMNELEHLLTCASVDQDVQRREYLLRCFRGFSGALKMMNRTPTYDSAVLAALNWEASVIAKAEEAMLRAMTKRQLAQKSPNAHARTKRNSDPTDPVSHSMDNPPAGRDNRLTSQNLQPNFDPTRHNPDTHDKTQLPPCHLPHQKSSHEKHSNLKTSQTSVASAAAYVTPGAREESDPSQVMESLVDPHLLGRHSPRRLHKFYQRGSHPNLAEMNKESQKLLDSSRLPTTQPQQVRIQPLVYDAQKNPYPPPEQLRENKLQSQIKPLVYDPRKNPYPPPEELPENKLANQNHRLKPSPSFLLSQNPLDEHNFPLPSSQNLDQHQRFTSHGKNVINPSQTTRIPFPSPDVPLQSFPGPPSARKSSVSPMSRRTEHPTSMLPGSSSSQRGSLFDSGSNLHSTAGLLHHQFIPSSRSENGESNRNLKRRPSKLVKLRRKGSGSTNNSNSSGGSFRQVRGFLGSLNKLAGRSSQSGDESDSTQDHGPNTPSSLEPGAGGGGSGFDSEGNERLRPMQAQFYRLFRKHNHPEHLRAQNRAKFASKPSPATQNSNKGKGRAVDFS